MKKWLYNLILVIFTFIGNAQDVSGKVNYIIIPSEIDNTIPNSAMGRATQQEMKERAEKQVYVLNFSNSVSKFEMQSLLLDDNEKEKRLQKLASIKYGATGTCFYNKLSNEIVMKLDDGTLLSKKEESKWIVLNESKQIGKYVCYKATCERKYVTTRGSGTGVITAWFAPELPYSYGPKDFMGLPGLILELQERKTTYLATNIDLDKVAELDLEMPKGKIIDYEEYNNRFKMKTK